MPLSKARQAERMREYRKRNRYNVIPNTETSVIPNKANTSVIPKQQGVIPDDTFIPFDADGK
uniref:Uncharacterized protein n=1 Tax=viral metagenome TaxID=1070528 RepID=A0A6H1ZJ51_9ZZZZ